MPFLNHSIRTEWDSFEKGKEGGGQLVSWVVGPHFNNVFTRQGFVELYFQPKLNQLQPMAKNKLLLTGAN